MEQGEPQRDSRQKAGQWEVQVERSLALRTHDTIHLCGHYAEISESGCTHGPWRPKRAMSMRGCRHRGSAGHRGESPPQVHLHWLLPGLRQWLLRRHGSAGPTSDLNPAQVQDHLCSEGYGRPSLTGVCAPPLANCTD